MTSKKVYKLHIRDRALTKYNIIYTCTVHKSRWSVKSPKLHLHACKVLALGDALNNLCILKRHIELLYGENNSQPFTRARKA